VTELHLHSSEKKNRPVNLTGRNVFAPSRLAR
jgi:hypothetical protein